MTHGYAAVVCRLFPGNTVQVIVLVILFLSHPTVILYVRTYHMKQKRQFKLNSSS